MKHYQSVELFSIFRMSSPPRRNAKPPCWKLSGDDCAYKLLTRDAAEAIGRTGGPLKVFRAMETCKKNKNREHMKVCLFLFVNEFDLKNNNRIYRKPF